MDYLQIFANAKINLALDVVGKRSDGYHELNTVMQTVSLRDTIVLRKIFTPKIKLGTNIKWLPCDERNLAYKAAKVLFDKYSPDFGVFIEIEKNIPVSAGLGGGSADCAAVLIGLNEMMGLGLSIGELMAIGKPLGADVPFCILKGTAQAQGIGEILTPLKPCPDIFIALAKPPVCVSTAEVFRQYSLETSKERPCVEKLIKDIEDGDIHSVAAGLINVLESVTMAEFPVISQIKAVMMDYGALGAVMSGSGPTVFGMFSDRRRALSALSEIRSRLSVREVHVANIYNPGRRDAQ